MEQRREQRLREIEIDDESIASLAIRKGSPCQQDDDGKRSKYSGPDLPEEIWCHIHSLMTLRDAAHAACLSHAFLCSWKRRPNLIFDQETLGWFRHDMDFTTRINRILEKHSGIGVKALKLDFSSYYEPKAYSYLNRWLQIAVTPGIEKLILVLSESDAAFHFPCSILSDGKGSSIWHLHLVHCAFQPTASIGGFRSLTVLHLDCVRITGDELWYIFSSCVALEQLNLMRCSKITCLKIPPWLQRLSYLQVLECHSLGMVKNEAPNICSFHLTGDRVAVSLGESLRLKKLKIICYRFLRYVREELPSIAPNVETLGICSREVVNTTMAFAPSKFLHLKLLGIAISGGYDYFSLVSLLDAAPLLETFILRLRISLQSEDLSHLRRMPSGYCHDKLKRVKIYRFYCLKSLVELTTHILENSASLECLTLDTTDGRYASINCSNEGSEKCSHLASPVDAHKTVLAIGKYIKGIVPPTVNLDVVEPCSRCHPVEL